ncbi:MAG: hypothetical protein H6739_09390 [Alphaproteobacteria bacterium]|nr:hypothetical protein [Alphaproteobacteria bacterium]
MRPRTHAWLCRLLVALGLSRGLLMLVGLKPVQFALIQLVCSPLPLVFDSPYYFARYSLALETDAGPATLPLDGRVTAQLAGPLGRTEVLTHAMAWSDLMPDELRGAILGHLFCTPGDFLRELGGPAGVRRVTVVIDYPGPGAPFVHRNAVDCAP